MDVQRMAFQEDSNDVAARHQICRHTYDAACKLRACRLLDDAMKQKAPTTTGS